MRRFVVFALVLGVVATAAADAPPWRARRRPGFLPNRMANARVSPSDWPTEPPSPAEVDADRYARALHELCGWMPRRRPRRYADWILRYASEFDEDPFLIGALIYRQTLGSCRSTQEGPYGGVGLTSIRREMYAATFRHGVYRYQVEEGGRWVERARRFDRFPFAGPRLRRAEENIYFAAALLSAWRDQHQSVDHAFSQVPHRDPVSHFVWGDRVRSARDEDRIFTDRRRLLIYYGATQRYAVLHRLGVDFGSPLDGAPRVVTSGIGQERDGGARLHRGVDVEAVFGEPVRTIADGRVVFAGVDLPGRRHNAQVALDGYADYPRSSLGRGGRFVCVLHRRAEQGSLRSCYMHLETVVVRAGQELHRGDLVGTVGRTGMRRSAAHLHLELHAPDQLLDASQVLAGILIGDPDPDL